MTAKRYAAQDAPILRSVRPRILDKSCLRGYAESLRNGEPSAWPYSDFSVCQHTSLAAWPRRDLSVWPHRDLSVATERGLCVATLRLFFVAAQRLLSDAAQRVATQRLLCVAT